MTDTPAVTDRLIGTCCSLSSEDLRPRLASWRALRDRASSIEPIPGGARIELAAGEAIASVAALVAAEAECCPFYSFTLRVDGPGRQLEITAGIGGEAAVGALIGLDS